MAAAITATLYSALFHGLMGLGAIRTLGSIQFLVVGWIAGWAFDTLRNREALRLTAETNLRSQQQASARYEERAILASRLHASVLQTLNVIRTHADDPDEVRYLARRQERELRRTIDEYRSPYKRSFRAELLGTRDQVEDLCRVEIEAVVRDDADLDATLAAVVCTAHEALVNAGKHSGAKQVHLYSEVADGRVTVNVRDRGRGLSDVAQAGREALWESLNERVSAFGGRVAIQSTVGEGTDVTIVVPRP
jgi:signal transduction histidine kinase